MTMACSDFAGSSSSGSLPIDTQTNERESERDIERDIYI